MKKAKSSYRSSTPKTRQLIGARLKEKFVLEDFKKVIEFKCQQWLNDVKMSAYIRPETLFGTKFESYLNEAKRGIGSQVLGSQATHSDEYLEKFRRKKGVNVYRKKDLWKQPRERREKRANCRCLTEKYEKEEQERQKQLKLKLFKKLQVNALMGEEYLKARFETAIVNEDNKGIYEKEIIARYIQVYHGLYIYGDNSRENAFKCVHCKRFNGKRHTSNFHFFGAIINI